MNWLSDTFKYYIYGTTPLDFPFPMQIVPEEIISREDELSKDFKKIIKNLDNLEQEYDFNFIIKNRIFHCHKMIIEIRSPILSKMINNKVQIELEEEPKVFEKLIEYSYTGELEIDIELGKDLYFLSKKYGFKELTETLLEYTIKEWDLKILIKEFKEEKDKNTLLKIKIRIEDEFENICQNNLLIEFNEKELIEILQNWEIDIDEQELFRNLLIWSEYHIKLGNNDPLKNILPLIRFGLMNQKLMNSEFKLFNKMISNNGEIRSKRHIKMKSDTKEILITKVNNQIEITKLSTNNWVNGKSYGNILIPYQYYEYTILEINKSDHSGIVFSISTDPKTSTYNNSIGIGMANGKYKIDKVISTSYGNKNDKIGIWYKEKEVIFYKNNIEIGRSNLLTNTSYYPLCFIYYQNDKVSLNITKKQ